MSNFLIESWISRLKKLDDEKHTERASIGRPLLKEHCVLCRIISEMKDTTTDQEFSV